MESESRSITSFFRWTTEDVPGNSKQPEDPGKDTIGGTALKLVLTLGKSRQLNWEARTATLAYEYVRPCILFCAFFI